jgi:hypothetical protein
MRSQTQTGDAKFIAGEKYFPVHQVLQGVSARVRHAFACGLSSLCSGDSPSHRYSHNEPVLAHYALALSAFSATRAISSGSAIVVLR